MMVEIETPWGTLGATLPIAEMDYVTLDGREMLFASVVAHTNGLILGFLRAGQ